MRGVITMNEEYETRFLCNSSKVRGWERDKGRGTRHPGWAYDSGGEGGRGRGSCR